jgi:16S rRNA (guanine527-N7)-methyltransferase
MENSQWLREQALPLGITLSDEQLDLFALYYERLVEMNQVMNLTSITEREDVYIKHFYDSLLLAAVVPIGKAISLIDVGTGAGFPGIPLKIAFPHLRVVLLDSLKKRVSFLADLVRELRLDNVETIHGRAEEWGRRAGYREAFDLATARAVARLNVLAEYCLPFVRVGGSFVAMKGPDATEERREAKTALQRLGGGEAADHKFTLPDGKGTRHLLVIPKRANTPKTYPRRPGTPSKQPIV